VGGRMVASPPPGPEKPLGGGFMGRGPVNREQL
jgi:hypothetical protein